MSGSDPLPIKSEWGLALIDFRSFPGDSNVETDDGIHSPLTDFHINLHTHTCMTYIIPLYLKGHLFLSKVSFSGSEAQEAGDICLLRTADSFCTAETHTTRGRNYLLLMLF